MSIQWYPGHMHKARKQMIELLPRIDVLVEILDARLPHSSKNPVIAEAAVELADADVQRGQAIYKSFPDNFHALELDRAIAVAKIAKLCLERTVAKKSSTDTLSQLQWQVEELGNQLLEIQIKMEERLPR